jgi:asparagine synthase (glutamine-hydrolysing)
MDMSTMPLRQAERTDVCGIGAIYDPTGTTGDHAVERVVEQLRHRGPDGQTTRRHGPISLVHTRLAIIDVAEGDQPFVSEDGVTTVIANGEIYNHLELRRELEALGHVFRSHSDCEVLLHGYEEWGLGVLGRLNGMFGFAVWDDREQRLMVARDAFGVKPVYWWTDGRRVVAASEVRAVLATGVVRAALDPVALDHLLAWRFVPAPRTLFAQISKLAPATALIVDPGGIRIHDFRAAPGPLIDPVDAADLPGEIRKRFVDAVARQMMSDVPYGAFLSGGLDSAAIVAAIALKRPEPPPLSFTIGFPGYAADLDERAAADATARALRSDHHATAMEMPDFLRALGESVRSVEEPCGAASAPAALALSRFTAQTVKVVLSGQGADEPWGGYQRHQAAALLGFVDRIPAAARRPLTAAAAIPRNERIKRATRLLHADAGLDRLLSIFEVTSPAVRLALRHDEDDAAASERRARAADLVADVAERDVLDQMLYLDTHLFLPDQLLLWGDKTSMAASLEQRVPFLDQELMGFVERIPARVRMHGARRKRLYREAMRTLVPPEVLDRKKHPFATPYDDWLRAALGDEVGRRFVPGGPLASEIDSTTVTRLVRQHQTGAVDHKRILYCLLELSEWHRAFVEGAT